MRPAVSIRHLSISLYLVIVFLLVSILINGTITFILYRAASQQVMKDIRQRLHDIVAISSGRIDGDGHQALMDAAQKGTPLLAQNSALYMELKQTLQQIRDKASDIHFIYTMRAAQAQKPGSAPPQIMFMVDAETDPKQMARLGDIYTDASPLLSRSFFDMSGPVIESSVYKDQWGVWLSGYAPFYDARGSRAGVVGVDISAATVAQYQHHLLTQSLTLFLATLPLVVGAAILLGRWFGDPLEMMQKGAQAIASGDLALRLKIPMGKETSILAKAMNQMAQSLQLEQDKLKQMIAKYRNIFENATEGIYQTTPDGRLLTANTAMVKMLGYGSLDEMLTAIDHDISHIYETPEDRQGLIRRLKRKTRISGFEARIRRKDRTVMTAELNVHICQYGEARDAQPIIEGSIRDITQRIEKEKADREKESALASSRAKSEFLANMSHEIRTPLNAVMGLTDLLGRTQLSHIQQQYLKKITISSKSLLAVINDILDFSKIEAGRLELEHLPFSLHDLMANISEMFAYKAEEKGLEFLISIDARVPSAVIGDSVRLSQVLINLVGNAVKFTEKGEIIVKAGLSGENGSENNRPNRDSGSRAPEDSPPHQRIRFSVQDTGIGIPLDRQQALFDSFTQADGSTTRKYGGTGLGLSISRQLVSLMGGDIRVTSTPGQGSCFFFSILLERQPEKNQVRLRPPRDLRGLKVLVVDDNPTARQLLAGIIQSFQMTAVTASSGNEALEILTRPSNAGFDLVLMDWKMPGMNGLDASRRIKQATDLGTPPIVCMISAHAREDLIHQADRKFLDAFLHKPVNPSFLFDTIMELFGRNEAKVSGTLDTAGPSPGPLENTRLSGRKILLVEDNEINREVAMEWLRSAGLSVDVAINGKAALSSLGILPGDQPPVRPDAVLMDIQMPEMDGYDATGHIRKDPRYRDLPIIAMTAHALKGDREKCLEAGMTDYITKPIDPALLFQVLARWTLAGDPQNPPDSFDPSAREPSAVNIPTGQRPEPDMDLSSRLVISGIDTAKGVYRVNNNLALYQKLLKSFVKDFSGADHGMSQELNAGLTGAADSQKGIEKACITAHSIKGVAANIGADDLSAAAARLEQAIALLKEAPEKKVPDDIWRTFCDQLQKVLSGIRDHTRGHDRPDSPAPVPDQNADQKNEKGVEFNSRSDQNMPTQDTRVLLEQLDRLDTLLDDDLSAARELAASMAPDLAAMAAPGLCEELMDAMDGFDIDGAYALIQKAAQAIELRHGVASSTASGVSSTHDPISGNNAIDKGQGTNEGSPHQPRQPGQNTDC